LYLKKKTRKNKQLLLSHLNERRVEDLENLLMKKLNQRERSYLMEKRKLRMRQMEMKRKNLQRRENRSQF